MSNFQRNEYGAISNFLNTCMACMPLLIEGPWAHDTTQKGHPSKTLLCPQGTFNYNPLGRNLQQKYRGTEKQDGQYQNTADMNVSDSQMESI